MTNIVNNGTVTVTNGSITVTGRGTSFQTALVTGGMLLVAGTAAFIRSVSSETRLTLTRPWPAVTARNANYEISRERAEAASAIIANDRLADAVARLQSGLLTLRPDAVGTRTQRSTHDDAPQGFIYIVPATRNGGSPTVYFKLSERSGHWSPAQSL